MLGKLFRNEIKGTWKTILTIYAITIVTSIIGSLFFEFNGNDLGKVGSIIGTSLTVAYIFSIIGLFLATFIYICSRFYKTMYSDQGYLTHTLPVSPLAHLNVKLITAFMWLFLAGVIFIISVIIILLQSLGGDLWEILFTNDFWNNLNRITQEAVGYDFLPVAGIMLLMVVVGCLNILCTVFSSFSIGQLFNQHKIGAAIGVGIGFYFLEQMIMLMILIRWLEDVYNEVTMVVGDVTVTYTDSSAFQIVWPIIIAFTAFAVVQYVITAVIVKKRLNLD